MIRYIHMDNGVTITKLIIFRKEKKANFHDRSFIENT
jgi:hypothetical protein